MNNRPKPNEFEYWIVAIGIAIGLIGPAALQFAREFPDSSDAVLVLAGVIVTAAISLIGISLQIQAGERREIRDREAKQRAGARNARRRLLEKLEMQLEQYEVDVSIAHYMFGLVKQIVEDSGNGNPKFAIETAARATDQMRKRQKPILDYHGLVDSLKSQKLKDAYNEYIDSFLEAIKFFLRIQEKIDLAHASEDTFSSIEAIYESDLWNDAMDAFQKLQVASKDLYSSFWNEWAGL